MIVHRLDVWQDPNSPLNIEFVADEILIFFRCLLEKDAEHGVHRQTKFLGLLRVENVIAIRSNRVGRIELFPSDVDHDFRGYYYEVQDSAWLNALEISRDLEDPGWRKFDKKIYRHFVFDSDKQWVEVIGTAVSFHRVKKMTNKTRKWTSIEKYLGKIRIDTDKSATQE